MLPPQAVRKKGIESVAVVLKNSYLFPDHERQVGELAKELGFTQVLPVPSHVLAFQSIFQKTSFYCRHYFVHVPIG